MSKKKKAFYPSWEEAYELLKQDWDITVWYCNRKIQMFKRDLTDHEDVFLRQNTFSALRMRNLIKEETSGALAADVYVIR